MYILLPNCLSSAFGVGAKITLADGNGFRWKQWKLPQYSFLKMASTGTALFGSNVGSSSKNLVEFRAGKMKLNGTTVTPDKRKGLVYVYQGEDSLMHFCWKDRTTGTVEDVCFFFTFFLILRGEK